MGSPYEMDPGVWSKLPQDLLECVFARLPTEGVARIRTLSKSWKLAASACSAFTRACAKVQPNLYGIMWFHCPYASLFETMFGRVYDTESCKWLNALNWALDGVQAPTGVRPLTKSKVSTYVDEDDWSDSFFTSMACDGGLVCLASASHRKIEVLPLIVGNPLTREWRQLPVHRLVKQYSFVQLKVDQETETYKIVIVGYVGGFPDSEVVAEVYSSSTNEWSRLESGLILGVDGCKLEAPPQVYDCSTSEVRDYIPPHTQGEVLRYKTHLNDLYVLEELPFYEDWMFDEDGHFIVGEDEEPISFSKLAVSKYEDGNWRFASNGSHQVARPPVIYKCELEGIPGELLLFVSGTLLVVVRNSFEDEDVHLRMFYGGKWHEFDWEAGTCPYDGWKYAFCGELRWDACP